MEIQKPSTSSSSNLPSTSVKTSVVITRLGDFWVTEKTAREIASQMDDKGAKIVLESVGVVSMNQVFAVLTKEGYEAYQKKQNGEWKCEKGSWHEKFKQCDCPMNDYDRKKIMEEMSKNA